MQTHKNKTEKMSLFNKLFTKISIVMEPTLWALDDILELILSVVYWWPLQTVWTQIRPDKMLGLFWTQSVWQSDGIPKRIFPKSWFWKKSADDKQKKNISQRATGCWTFLIVIQITIPDLTKQQLTICKLRRITHKLNKFVSDSPEFTHL